MKSNLTIETNLLTKVKSVIKQRKRKNIFNLVDKLIPLKIDKTINLKEEYYKSYIKKR